MNQIKFFIAGVQFRPAADFDRAIKDGLAEGSKLQLIPEPKNQYDANAIRIDHYGVLLGYVPRAMQPQVRGLTTATMGTFDMGDPPWERFPVICEVGAGGPLLDAQNAPKLEETALLGILPANPTPRSGEETALEIVAAPYPLDSVTATAAAMKQRDELLWLSRQVSGISSAAVATSAARLLHDIAAFTRTIEETRKVVKAPLLEAERKIDATAKALTSDLIDSEKRLGNLLGAYQAAQKKIEEDNRRRAYEEQERIRRIAESEERRIREEREVARQKLNEERNAAAQEVDPSVAPADYADLTLDQFAEAMVLLRIHRKTREQAEKSVAKAKTEKAKAEAERKAQEARDAEAKRLADDATRAEVARREREDREHREEQARWNEAALASAKAAELPTAPPTKLHGIAVGSEIKFEVTNIIALYEAAPYLVKLEPNTAALKSALKQLAEGQTLPGVRHWREAKTTVRQ